MRTPALWQRKASAHLGKHSHNNKNILLTRTKRQLNKVQAKCTTMDEGMYQQILEKMPGSRLEPCSCPGFPVAPSVHVISSHCLPILISMIQEQSVAMSQGHQDGLHPRVPQSDIEVQLF